MIRDASVLVRPRTVQVDQRMVLSSAEPQATISFVTRLRDLQSASTDVLWHGLVTADIDVTLLVHLAPPQPDADMDGRMDHWRTVHRPGLCFFRTGPGFIEIRDTRRPLGSAARFVIDDPDLMDAFKRFLNPCRLADLSAIHQEAAQLLLEEQLLLSLGGWVTALPNRMRRWPIPSPIV
ncbi:DUF5825 family protein [Dactylosporangium sucinum]|uniref:Uncharacterized protein n=1 Tax=Dactylosporangium sucinum TaxID=1424081 RepID=A0A917TJV4_9ACTN|nr:DUF5825 family protein [Dactylosporangium sucinum]GGM23453.1 hypothetical protein GCM10007977_025830 [Dactylosporangium sucinum]